MTSSNVRRVVIRWLACLFALGAWGCGGEVGTQAPATDDVIDVGPPELQSIQRTLRLGTSGEDVAVLNAFLTKSGYFPNDGLARLYPAWRPIVEEAPRDARVFDENTLRAVEAYQRNSGMPVTGEFTADMRDLLAARVCGVPDGMGPIDPSEKFSTVNRWPTNQIGWVLLNTDGDLTIEVVRAQLTAAFARWAATTDLTFVERSVTDIGVEITLMFAPPPGGNFDAQAFANTAGTGGMMVAFNPSRTWSDRTGVAGTLDLQSVAMHEIGHALGPVRGLDHSAILSAKMHFTAPGGRNLFPEDHVAVSVLYDTWTPIPGNGLAQDIAGLPTDHILSESLLWAVGFDEFAGGNYGIWRWNGSTWRLSDLTGVKVAAEPNGLPWAIKANGDVYCRTSHNLDTGGWRSRQACATEMAIGANGTVWAVQCNGQLIKWVKPEKCTHNIVAGDPPWRAVSFLPGKTPIIVGVTPNGTPWVIDSNLEIFRRGSGIIGGTPTQSAWTEVPSDGRAIDISIDASGYAYVLGTNNVPGTLNFGIWVWNEQPCVDTLGNRCANVPPDNGAPLRQSWIPMTDGVGWNLTTAGTARPIVALFEGPMYRTLR
jgi:peptidoglycan hydrolase-like protein with peptidoglycan-binding domain